MTERIMTASTVSDNPYIAAMISAARRGETKSSTACLYLLGHALRDQKPLDPALAQFVGGRLIETAKTFAATSRQKTEKKATEVAKALGLIAPRPGPRTTRFEPFRHWFYLASLVVRFHQQGCPLTRNEGGAFFKAAKTTGCGPGTTEAAYRKFIKNESSYDSAMQKATLDFEETLNRLRRKRN